MSPLEVLWQEHSRADCARRQVGAVVLWAGRVVGQGRNAMRDGESCTGGDCPRGKLTYEQQPAGEGYYTTGQCWAIHAEVAALRQAGGRALGAVMMVTAQPCPGCLRDIEEAGIAEVRVVDYPSAQYATVYP